MGHAEEISLVRADVEKMLASEGLYVAGDSRHPNVIVPLWVSGGKVYSMAIDTELAPERFLPELVIYSGPHGPKGLAE